MAEYKERLVADFTNENPMLYIHTEYGETYYKIMRGVVDDDDTREILESCKYNKDSRTLIQYAQEIILGWVVEDFTQIKLAKALEHAGWKVRRGGADKKRRFLRHGQITTAADLIMIAPDETEYACEVVMDYWLFWEKKGVAHMRGRKLKRLRKEAETGHVMILLIDVKGKRVGMIPVSDDLHSKRVNNGAWGGKEADEIEVNVHEFTSIE